MKSRFRIAMLCAFALVFAALPAFAAGTVLTIGQGAEPVELDPQNITDNPSEEVCHNIYEGLVGFDVKDDKLVVAPRLADTWEVTPDGKTWTFHLKKGVVFHSGAPFDAAAVKLTGNVVGQPPFSGSLSHRGWRVAEVRLPKLAEGHDARVLAPAEVEL